MFTFIRKIFFLSIIILSFAHADGRAQTLVMTRILDNPIVLSPRTTISLLTAAPGEPLYSVFGHSAIRVKDDISGADIVFNYGLFDFSQPNFYVNFARGRMNYRLGVESFSHFYNTYALENRDIREQVFELDSVQKQFVIHFLDENYKPENRHYMYHFFLDNCATRIRDLVLQTYTGMELPVLTSEKFTYRDLIHLYLKNHPWGRLGIDIGLGLPTDQLTDTYAQMFLPDYMFDAFARSVHNGQPIITRTDDLFKAGQPAVLPPGPVTPMVVCCLILVLSVVFCFVRKGARAFDFTLFFITGLVGLLVTFLWFFTDHTNTQNNLNIIWALPTNLVMAFFLLSKSPAIWVKRYFLVTAILAVLLLLAWFFLPQKLNPALIPLTISIVIRGYRISKSG